MVVPKISVIVPVYNVEQYIAQCLDSIVNQTFKDIEILCVDDCGTDESMQIVRCYAGLDSRIKIITHEHNKGLGSARHSGLQHARGRYISFVDSDDWLDVTMFEKCYNVLERERVDSVWVKINLYFEDERKFVADAEYLRDLHAPKEGVIEITPENISHFPVNAWNKIYKASAVNQNKAIFSEGILYEDVEFYYRFFTQSTRVYILDELLYQYRQRKSSIMGKTFSGKGCCEDICKVMKRVYDYLCTANLLEKYREAFIECVVKSCSTYVNNRYYTMDMVEYVQDLLQYIGYPQHYTLHKKRNLLKVIENIRLNRKGNCFVLLLIGLIPIKKIRRRIRAEYKKRFHLSW